MWLIFHSEGKTPEEIDKLNKYNKGTAKTNLHCIKNKLDIMSCDSVARHLLEILPKRIILIGSMEHGSWFNIYIYYSII